METVAAIPKYNLTEDQEKKLILREYRALLRSLKPKLKLGDKEFTLHVLWRVGVKVIQAHFAQADNSWIADQIPEARDIREIDLMAIARMHADGATNILVFAGDVHRRRPIRHLRRGTR